MKKHPWIVAVALIAALAALVFWGRNRIHFDFGVFRAQIALADWRRMAVGVGCIYLAYAFRSVRWSLLLRHNKKVPLLSLTGTQVIGFTAVALIGRVADPVRPYLVAKRTATTLSTQLAVYIVERLFDAASMALIISVVLLAAPPGSMPHAEIAKKAGFGGLAASVVAGLFLVAVRLYGERVAGAFERLFGRISPKLGHAAAHKIRSFHAGLDIMRSVSDFLIAISVSLVMWAIIAMAYLEAMRAFPASPALAGMNLPRCMVMMAASGGASLFQLPVVGWFSQIAFVATALSTFLSVPPEAATACAAVLLLVTFLSVIPAGLIWARFEQVSLRKIATESEHAEEALEEAAG